MYKDPNLIRLDLTKKIKQLKRKGQHIKLSQKDIFDIGWIQYTNNIPKTLNLPHLTYQDIRSLLCAPSGLAYVELGGFVGKLPNNVLSFIKDNDISHLDIHINGQFKPYVKFDYLKGNIYWHSHPWNANNGNISIFSKGDLFDAINNPGKMFVLFVPNIGNNYHYPTEYIYTFRPTIEIEQQISSIEFLQEDLTRKIADIDNVPGMPLFVDWNNIIQFLERHGIIMEINLNENEITFLEKFNKMREFLQL